MLCCGLQHFEQRRSTMHWSTKKAKEIIEANPDLDEYVCASGISPSGTVHSGNLREYLTTYFVVQALKKEGKNAKMILSWDDFDRLRKIPANYPQLSADNIGRPYSEIPSPIPGYQSFADMGEKEFESSLKKLNIDTNFIYQNKMYKSGKYTDQIAFALKNRKKIYDIIMSFKSQEANEEDRNAYSPVAVYCSKCLHDSTKVVDVSDDGYSITYECECGHKETIDIRKYRMLKLQWKIDWPMRWVYEGVKFEPGGRDHSTPGGSYDVCSKLVRELYGKEPPQYLKYEWIGISGQGDMHSSSGLNLSPAALLKLYEPEVFLWLYAKYDSTEVFNFAFDGTIQRQYSEFDRMLDGYMAGTLDEYNTTVMELALNGNKPQKRIPFGTLANLAPLVNYDRKLLAKIVEKLGYEFDKASEERFDKVEYWLKNFEKPEPFELLKSKNETYFSSLVAKEKEDIKKVYALLKNADNMSDKDIQQGMYEIVNNPALSKKENMNLQMVFFKNLYNLLFGTDKGPRLYLYFATIESEKYLPLLDF